MSSVVSMIILVASDYPFLQAAYCLSAIASGAKAYQRAKFKQDCPLSLSILAQMLDNVMRLGGVWFWVSETDVIFTNGDRDRLRPAS